MTAAPPIAAIPDLAQLDVVLTTTRLTLRPFAATDVDDLWPIVSDPAFPRQMAWEAHRDRGETLAFIASTHDARASGAGVVWALEYAGHAVGCVSVVGIRRRIHALRCDHAELGYWLAPALHGRGLMTEAGRAVLRFAFDTLGLHKLTTAHFVDNAASRTVIEKLGFRLIGRTEDDVYRDGRWHAHLRYELLADDPVDIALTQPMSRP